MSQHSTSSLLSGHAHALLACINSSAILIYYIVTLLVKLKVKLMDEYFEDESPTYSQVEWRYPAIVTENATSITVQNTGYSDHELNLANRHATRFSG